MKFESLKCDECKRIQDGANHWVKMGVHYTYTPGEQLEPDFSKMTPSLIALGQVEETSLILGHSVALAGNREATIIHDLCGQGCAVKHIAKLLKWNVATEAQS